MVGSVGGVLAVLLLDGLEGELVLADELLLWLLVVDDVDGDEDEEFGSGVGEVVGAEELSEAGTTSSVFIFFLSMVGGTLELVVLDCSMAEETSCSISSRTSLPAVRKGVTVMMTPVSRYS